MICEYKNQLNLKAVLDWEVFQALLMTEFIAEELEILDFLSVKLKDDKCKQICGKWSENM